MLNLNFEQVNKPLQGLKVLDLSSILAGPLTGSFFAELGADVIKIENKLTQGDATRQWKLPSEDAQSPFSAYYCSANFGKKVRLLDLSNPEDRAEVDTLLSGSDIVISNFQKKTAEKLRLSPDEILSAHPNIIFAQLSAYEYDDPRPGYDLVMQGETGWISMNGSDEEHLSKLPVAIIDIIAAHQMKEAILLALLKKSIMGAGSVVHVSLYHSAISGLANQASNYLMAGHIPLPLGTLHPNIAPYGDVFFTKESKKVILAVGSDGQFKKLWFSLNIPAKDYLTFELNSERLKQRNDLQNLLQQSIGGLTFDELENILKLNNIPFCLVKNMKDVFEDPLAKKMVNVENFGQFDSKSVSNIAFRFPFTPQFQ